MSERLPVRDALFSFAAQEPLRAALFLTYSFDGQWFEEAIVPGLCERPIATPLVVRDRNAIVSEAPSVRYRKANACESAVFHPKLALLISENSVRAVISSANLTRGGFERQRELGRVFDLAPSMLGDRHVFEALSDYLQNGLMREVRGDAARDLGEISGALAEVLEQYQQPPEPSPHLVLHNYQESIWSQMLARLPHRVLRRAVIVSPFFEPDRERPEDPALGPDDTSIFARALFHDFTFETERREPAVRVLFRQSQGRTELPVQKLSALKNRLAFFAQDEREQRLHAKLVVLEGADGEGREPFLVTLYGSPNFTTAGLLQRPPNGNSELAVLTVLPPKRRRFDHILQQLQLESGFVQVADIAQLESVGGGDVPEPISQGVADATFQVADRTVKVTLLHRIAKGTHLRLLIQRDGSWLTIGEASIPSDALEVVVPVIGLAEIDKRTGLLELRASSLRLEIVSADGTVHVSEAPINVDIPEEFCGLTLVGPEFLSLDERIAKAGLGVPVTYKEQQKWLEALRTVGQADRAFAPSDHHADLDRFYRNVDQGLRGVQARMKVANASEYAVRRCLDELLRWTIEASDAELGVLSKECRVFLIDRLLRAMSMILQDCQGAGRVGLSAIARDLCVGERCAPVITWLDRIDQPTLREYAQSAQQHVRRSVELCNGDRID